MALKFKPPRTGTGKVAPFPRAKFEKFLSHLKIQSRDYGGKIPFRPLGSQRYILDEIEKGLKEGVTTFVIVKSRQQGSTTILIALDMFWAFQYEGLLGTFILHEDKALAKWRAIIDIFYHAIPSKIAVAGRAVRFKPRKTHHNRDILQFSNDSMFSYLIAGTQENKAAGLGRSGATNFVHATEVAFYGSSEDIKAFKSSISALYEHRLQVYESTANGFNHFYDTCQQAKASPATMRFIFSGWWRDERCQFPTDDTRYKHFMRDTKLTIVERARVRNVKEQYGFVISLQQVAWYRWKLEDEFENDQTMMDQEYPWTEEDAFQATGSKYFLAATLTVAMREARKHPFQGYRYKMTTRWDDIAVQGFPDPRAELRVWEQASRFGYYAISCDPAYGSSDEADRNVISVWRCYAECMVQVAEFACPWSQTYQTAWVLAHLAGFYGINESHVMIELNGPGKAVFAELRQIQTHLREMSPTSDNFELRNCLKGMRDFYYQRLDSVGGGDLAYHWTMTEDLKRYLMTSFKNAVELARMHIRSLPLLEEMRQVVNDEGHIAAQGGGNDDRVVAAALAHEVWRKWLQPKLKGMHMTRARSAQIEASGEDQPINKLVLNWLRKSNIEVPLS
jgi:hypothetical protein